VCAPTVLYLLVANFLNCIYQQKVSMLSIFN
jgi:hypothetical protein